MDLNAFARGGCKGSFHDRTYRVSKFSLITGTVEPSFLMQFGHAFGCMSTKIASRSVDCIDSSSKMTFHSWAYTERKLALLSMVYAPL